MPSKRQNTSSGKAPAKKKKVSEADINYDKLAAATLKLQGSD